VSIIGGYRELIETYPFTIATSIPGVLIKNYCKNYSISTGNHDNYFLINIILRFLSKLKL